MSLFNKFTQLQNMPQPLMMGNVWDAQSALLHEKIGYKAIGTSSAAIAASLGYEDGERMPFEALVDCVKQIQALNKLPLNVDIEAGYARNIDDIIKNVARLSELGVVGINIEDSIDQSLIDGDEFAKLIREIKAAKLIASMFINARSDAYILGLENAFDISYERVRLYQEAGADMVFLPCLYDVDEVRRLTRDLTIPINLMAVEQMGAACDYNDSNVKRISMGPFSYLMKDDRLKERLENVLKDNHLEPLFGELHAK